MRNESFQIIFAFCKLFFSAFFSRRDSDADCGGNDSQMPSRPHTPCTYVYRNTSSSSSNSHLHHVHPFTPNCKKLALIYTLPSSSGSVCDPSQYDGGDVIATTIDCCALSPAAGGGSSSWCGVPPFNCWAFSTSTTWIGADGACITPEFDPRFPCALSIKSIDVVVVGVVGAPDENLMLYGCRFVNFCS